MEGEKEKKGVTNVGRERGKNRERERERESERDTRRAIRGV